MNISLIELDAQRIALTEINYGKDEAEQKYRQIIEDRGLTLAEACALADEAKKQIDIIQKNIQLISVSK